jgi:Beta-propeller repeat
LGTASIGNGIALDSAGNAYVMGITSATDFPTTPGAFQAVLGGGCTDIFVTKLDTTGSTLMYSTFLGGSGCDGSENSGGIAVDPSGNAYVGNATFSTDFPTSSGAFQTVFTGNYDATVTVFAPNGSLVYSTYLGGSAETGGNAVAADAAGNAYVTGSTNSLDSPTSPGAFHATLAGASNAFVARARLDRLGSAWGRRSVPE